MTAGKRSAQVPDVPAIRELVFSLTERDDACMRGVILCAAITDNNLQLAILCIGLGAVATSKVEGDTAQVLSRFFGCVFGWLKALKAKLPFLLIHRERERQQKLFKAGKFSFTCASRTASFERKLRVLTEEIGEVAEAIDLLEQVDSRARREQLITEIVQVAAVAVAWLESLEPQSTTKE